MCVAKRRDANDGKEARNVEQIINVSTPNTEQRGVGVECYFSNEWK